MAPFRLGHDENQHELPWRLMQNGPVTMYWRREYLDEEVEELAAQGFEIRRFDCSAWDDDGHMHRELRDGLGLPSYTGASFDALADSLTDMAVPETGGLAVVLDDFDGSRTRDETLLEVLAGASRWWLLFGRLLPVLIRTDDVRYRGPAKLGAVPAMWNGREWLNANRGVGPGEAEAVGEGFRAMPLDALEDVPWKEGLHLRPVRSQLGLRAFGAAGFVGRDPGDIVVEPHTEVEGRGHQELYVVLRGAARFMLDGETLEAPAGTLVVVEPHVHREAVATEADTAVLAFGGPPTFKPAGHEYMARVRGALDRPQDALAIAEAGLRELRDSAGAQYAMALATAANGDREAARRWLQRAIARERDLYREARSETLLAPLLAE